MGALLTKSPQSEEGKKKKRKKEKRLRTEKCEVSTCQRQELVAQNSIKSPKL